MARTWSIAILSCDERPAQYAQGASWRYRGDNLGHALRQLGHHVVMGHIDHTPAQHWDLVLLLRPRNSWAMRRRLRAWRRQGTRLLADFDDLVFDPSVAPQSPGVLNQRVSLAAVAARFQAHRTLLSKFDACSVSTQALSDELQATLSALGAPRPVHCLHNAVHWRWRGLPATPWPTAPKLVTYCSGTHSHDRDLAVASAGLGAALAAQPDWALQLVGRGDFSVKAGASVLRVPFLPFDNGYTDALRRSRLALMPLEPTRFNRCKSALKFIEAGWWNVPLLASVLPDAQRLACPGLMPVERPDDWVPLLSECLAAPEHLAQRAHGLREWVLRQADADVLARQWCQWVRRVLAPGA